jgi:hypothetical protein
MFLIAVISLQTRRGSVITLDAFVTAVRILHDSIMDDEEENALAHKLAQALVGFVDNRITENGLYAVARGTLAYCEDEEK